jgi:hypothetical protein
MVLVALIVALQLSEGGAAGPSDAGPTDEKPAIQKGPEVGTARSAASPPLRDLKPGPRKACCTVHPVKPVPRPAAKKPAQAPAPEGKQ